MAINYNEPITFGLGGTAEAMNYEGLDFSEESGQSWTNAPVAELDVQLPFARQDVEVELTASPFLAPGVLDAQSIFVFLGGLFVGYCTLRGHAVRSFPVSRNLVSGRPARLSLVLPNATSPHALALSEDRRQLGIYLASITFRLRS